MFIELTVKQVNGVEQTLPAKVIYNSDMIHQIWSEDLGRSDAGSIVWLASGAKMYVSETYTKLRQMLVGR